MDRRGELHPTRPDAAEIELDEDFWKNAVLVMPGEPLPGLKSKTSVELPVNPEVLDWFRQQGKGHLTRMSKVLRAYYLANRKKAS